MSPPTPRWSVCPQCLLCDEYTTQWQTLRIGEVVYVVSLCEAHQFVDDTSWLRVRTKLQEMVVQEGR